MNLDVSGFVHEMCDLMAVVHATAKRNGFWDDFNDNVVAHHLAKMALIVSEVGEAVEAIRDGGELPDKHLPHLSNLEVELADIIIRIMDYAEHNGLLLAEAIQAKATFNESREHLHGRKA